MSRFAGLVSGKWYQHKFIIALHISGFRYERAWEMNGKLQHFVQPFAMSSTGRSQAHQTCDCVRYDSQPAKLTFLRGISLHLFRELRFTFTDAEERRASAVFHTTALCLLYCFSFILIMNHRFGWHSRELKSWFRPAGTAQTNACWTQDNLSEPSRTQNSERRRKVLERDFIGCCQLVDADDAERLFKINLRRVECKSKFLSLN